MINSEIDYYINVVNTYIKNTVRLEVFEEESLITFSFSTLKRVEGGYRHTEDRLCTILDTEILYDSRNRTFLRRRDLFFQSVLGRD